MLALFASITAVAVERFINRRRFAVHEVLRDVGWLTLIFAFIEFSSIYIVEAATLNYGSAVWLLWHIEWPLFKGILLETATAVFLILSSVWIEQAGIAELRVGQLRRSAAVCPPAPAAKDVATASAVETKCDVEW
jgi:hypothetical protein